MTASGNPARSRTKHPPRRKGLRKHDAASLNAPSNPDYDHTLHLLTRELLAARVRARMTQEDVAWRMGTTRSAISRLEGDGGHRPSFATIEKYAAAVGCYVHLRLCPLPIE